MNHPKIFASGPADSPSGMAGDYRLDLHVAMKDCRAKAEELYRSCLRQEEADLDKKVLQGRDDCSHA